MVTNRKFKYGQLFTHDNHVYQVRKTPDGILSCEFCEYENRCELKFGFDCIIPNFDCANLIPLRAYLKRIK